MRRSAIFLAFVMSAGLALPQPAQAGKLPVRALFKLARVAFKGAERARLPRLRSTSPHIAEPARPSFREPAPRDGLPGKQRDQSDSARWSMRAPFLLSHQSCSNGQTNSTACNH